MFVPSRNDRRKNVNLDPTNLNVNTDGQGLSQKNGKLRREPTKHRNNEASALASKQKKDKGEPTKGVRLQRIVQSEAKQRAELYAEIDRIQKELDQRNLAAQVIGKGLEKYVKRRLRQGLRKFRENMLRKRQVEVVTRKRLKLLVNHVGKVKKQQAIKLWRQFVRIKRKQEKQARDQAAATIQNAWRKRKAFLSLIKRQAAFAKRREKAMGVVFLVYQIHAFHTSVRRRTEQVLFEEEFKRKEAERHNALQESKLMAAEEAQTRLFIFEKRKEKVEQIYMSKADSESTAVEREFRRLLRNRAGMLRADHFSMLLAQEYRVESARRKELEREDHASHLAQAFEKQRAANEVDQFNRCDAEGEAMRAQLHREARERSSMLREELCMIQTPRTYAPFPTSVSALDPALYLDLRILTQAKKTTIPMKTCPARVSFAATFQKDTVVMSFEPIVQKIHRRHSDSSINSSRHEAFDPTGKADTARVFLSPLVDLASDSGGDDECYSKEKREEERECFGDRPQISRRVTLDSLRSLKVVPDHHVGMSTASARQVDEPSEGWPFLVGVHSSSPTLSRSASHLGIPDFSPRHETTPRICKTARGAERDEDFPVLFDEEEHSSQNTERSGHDGVDVTETSDLEGSDIEDIEQEEAAKVQEGHQLKPKPFDWTLAKAHSLDAKTLLQMLLATSPTEDREEGKAVETVPTLTWHTGRGNAESPSKEIELIRHLWVQNYNATRIQCAYRQAKARYALQVKRAKWRMELEERCSIKIQKVWRGAITRSQRSAHEQAKLNSKIMEEYLASYKEERLQKAWKTAYKIQQEKENQRLQFWKEDREETERRQRYVREERERATANLKAWQRIAPAKAYGSIDGQDIYFYNPTFMTSQWEPPEGFWEPAEEERKKTFWEIPPDPEELKVYLKGWMPTASEDGQSIEYVNSWTGEQSQSKPLGYEEPIQESDVMLRPQEDVNEKSIVYCGICRGALADRRCKECGPMFPYCFTCFLLSHKSQTLREHLYEIIPDADDEVELDYDSESDREEEYVDEAMCTECEVVQATLLCEQCGDQMCRPCFDRLHAKGNRQKHTWEPYDGCHWEEYFNKATGKSRYYNKQTRELTEVCPVELMYGPERREYLDRQAREKQEAREKDEIQQLEAKLEELETFREKILREEQERLRLEAAVAQKTSKIRMVAHYIAPSLVKAPMEVETDVQEGVNERKRVLPGQLSRKSTMYKQRKRKQQKSNAAQDAAYLQRVMVGKAASKARSIQSQDSSQGKSQFNLKEPRPSFRR